MSRRSSISVMESMTCRSSSSSAGLVPRWSLHGGGGNVPQATDLILLGECPQAIHLPHESDAPQSISVAEVGQEKTDSVAGR